MTAIDLQPPRPKKRRVNAALSAASVRTFNPRARKSGGGRGVPPPRTVGSTPHTQDGQERTNAPDRRSSRLPRTRRGYLGTSPTMESNTLVTPVAPALPLAGYFGGKRLLAKRITTQIDARPHRLYAEPFVGMGGVFFRRRRRPRGEIINDIDEDIANLFHIVQNHPDAFAAALDWMPSSRAEFDRQRALAPRLLTDIRSAVLAFQRAVRFMYLQRHSFAGLPVGIRPGFSVDKHSPAKMSARIARTRIDKAFLAAVPGDHRVPALANLHRPLRPARYPVLSRSTL